VEKREHYVRETSLALYARTVYKLRTFLGIRFDSVFMDYPGADALFYIKHFTANIIIRALEQAMKNRLLEIAALLTNQHLQLVYGAEFLELGFPTADSPHFSAVCRAETIRIELNNKKGVPPTRVRGSKQRGGDGKEFTIPGQVFGCG